MNSSSSVSGQESKLSSANADIPLTDVSVYQALYQRRMSWQFQDRPVPRDTIDRILAAAVWAPNHRLTEPWRFFVVAKDSAVRQRLGGQVYEMSMERNNNPDRASAAKQALLDPPYIIYVYCVPGPNEATTKENYGAVCCAAQNISLAGVAEGLAVTWETGGPTRDPKLKEALGAEPEWDLAVMLSTGIAADSPESSRPPATAFTHWLS